jgi:two-component system LytT family response regulator
MLSCLIVDDEKNARESLQKLIERGLPDSLKVLSAVNGVKEAVVAIHKFNPDIVFLDIEMPLENGFKLFEYFDEVKFGVIFTTAYDHYAVEAIKFAAFDYLLKPINLLELRDAINRFNKLKPEKSTRQQIELLLSNLQSGAQNQQKILFTTFDGFRLEKANHIMYCEADRNYTKVAMINGEVFYVSRNLSVMETQLPTDQFYRIHKSFIVNLGYIKSYSRNDGSHIILENGMELPVATRRIDEFIQMISASLKN